jgi:hypothetical protein
MSLQQAGEAITSAWRSMHGEDPPEGLVPLLVGQVSIETGGGKGMLNYNFAGIKGTGPFGMSVRFRTTEGDGPTERKIVDRFRAYRSAEEGATDYLRLLENRFGGALDKAREGDAEGFVHELKKSGYFTGNEKVYTRVVRSVAENYQPGAISPSSNVAAAPPAAAIASRPVSGASASVPSGIEELLAREQDSQRDLAWISVMTTMNIADELARAAMRIATAGDESNSDYDIASRMIG